MNKIVYGVSVAAVLMSAACGSRNEQPAEGMVDDQATTETKHLYSNIKELQGKATMFGHQDDTAYGIGWKYEEGRSDVKSVTGDYPAVYGWEIGGIELGWEASLDSVHFATIRKLMTEAYQRGGVNTVSWHAHNPLTGGNTWDVSKGGVVASVIAGGANHDLFNGWLDKLADFFLSLKGERGELIPVLFRPLHEHTGSWFWWGDSLCTQQEYVELWRYTVKYLRDERKVHNLIYVYSPDRVPTVDKYLEKFPGSEYVDLFALDVYHIGGDEGVDFFHQSLAASFTAMVEASAQYAKPYAFSETGLECVTMPDWFTRVLYPTLAQYHPAYVLVWRNAVEKPNHYYAPYPGHTAAADLIELMNKEDILFNKEVPDMYNSPKL